jgi:hypothetical protein
MRFSAIVASSVLISFTAGHGGGHGGPKLLGAGQRHGAGLRHNHFFGQAARAARH